MKSSSNCLVCGESLPAGVQECPNCGMTLRPVETSRVHTPPEWDPAAAEIAFLTRQVALLREILPAPVDLVSSDGLPPALIPQEKTVPVTRPGGLPPTVLKKARLVLRETFERGCFLGSSAVEDALFISKGRFVTMADDRKARLWGLGRESTGMLQETSLPAQPLYVALHREQRLLAVDLVDRITLLWELGERFRHKLSLEIADEVGALAFSTDGKRLALGGVSGQIAIF